MLQLYRRLWRPLAETIAGRRCVYVSNDLTGNWGDRLIDAGTVAWLEAEGIAYQRVLERQLQSAPRDPAAQILLLYGSGSVGVRCPDVVHRRRRIVAKYRLPAILLPSTAWDAAESLAYCQLVCLRDHVSHSLYRDVHPRTVCLPCMAEWAPIEDPWQSPPQGVARLLRVRSNHGTGDGDPAAEPTLDAYVRRCGCAETIVTDRLHVAITARRLGRQVVMLPCGWHKCRAYYETWYSTEGHLTWQDTL